MAHLKRKLTAQEEGLIFGLLERNVSFKSIIKFCNQKFGLNMTKPMLLKAVGGWKSEEKTAADGTLYKFRRGKVEVIKKDV